MRVAHVLKSLEIGGLGGGAERFALALSQALTGRVQAQTLVICLRTGSAVEQQWQERAQAGGSEVIYLQDEARLKPLAGARAMQAQSGRYAWDIVHAHYQVGALYACLVKQACLVRTVHTPLEWGGGPASVAARAIFSRLIFPLVYRAQVGVSMGITGALNRTPGARLARRQAVYIPNALPDEWLSAARLNEARQRQHRSEGSLVVGSVGRLVPNKGYADLITAFAQVKAAFTGAQLWLVGDGNLRPALEKQAAELGLTDVVRFWGQTSDVAGLLARMDLMVLPSQVEGLPTVLLESMACGTPVAGTRIPGVMEIIREGQTGWLAQPADPQSLAQTICSALADAPMRARCSAQALDQLAAFSMSRVAERYLGLYRSLLKTAPID